MKKIIKLLLGTSLFVIVSMIFSCANPPSTASVEETRRILRIKFLQNRDKKSDAPPVVIDDGSDSDKDGIPDVEEIDTDGDGLHNHVDPDIDNDAILNGADPDVDNDNISGILDTGAADIDDNNLDDDIDGDGTLNHLDPDMDSDGMLNDVDPDDNANGKTDAPSLNMAHRDPADPWQNVNLGQKIFTQYKTLLETPETEDTHFDVRGIGAYAGNWLLNHHGDNITIYHNALDIYNDSYPYNIKEEGQELGKVNITGISYVDDPEGDVRYDQILDVNYDYRLEADGVNWAMSPKADCYTTIVNYKPENPTSGTEFEYTFKQNSDLAPSECVGIRVKDSNGVWAEEQGDITVNPRNYTPTPY